MDRRNRSAHVWDRQGAHGIRRYRLLIGSALILLTLLFSSRTVRAVDAVALLTGLGFILAGAARLVGWKVTGWAPCAWLGIAWMNLGVLTVAHHFIFASTAVANSLGNSIGLVLIASIVVVLLVAGMRAPEVDSGLRPGRILVLTLAPGFWALAALVRFMPTDIESARMSATLSTVCAAIWTLVALYAFTRRALDECPARIHSVIAIGLLAAGTFAGQAVTTAAGVSSIWTRFGTFAASVVALLTALYLLRRVLDGQARHLFGLHTDLEGTREQIEREKAELEERLHDLRNAVTGVRAADAALRRYGPDLDPLAGAQLADAITAELSRLQTLVEPDQPLEIGEMSLDGALDPVIALARASNMMLQVDLSSDTVLADPAATARIVQNLLVNARLHAPGASVSIVSRRVVDRIELVVSDNGPGVPPFARASLFERGFRGGDSGETSGSGVGLFVASRLAAGMDGDLRLEPSAAGASFVLTLPAHARALGVRAA